MFDVSRPAANRLDIVMRGKLDASAMANMIELLLRQAEGIEKGRMLVDAGYCELPTPGALKVELSHLPELLRFSRQFARIAILADAEWIRTIGDIESKLIPGLVIQSFPTGQRYHAETWLQN